MIFRFDIHIWKTIKLFGLVVISFLCISTSKFQVEDKLVGKWKATDYYNNVSEFVFTEEKTISFSIKNQQYGGKGFQMNGKPVDLKYTINENVTPYALDVIAYDKETQQVLLKAKGLIEFINYNKVKFLLNLDNKRITHFEEKHNKKVIILER